MQHAETDYLIIGSGTAGLAFADTLIAESGAHVTIVDRHGRPGGHWNDAYPFVTLHQPSAFYGVNSMELGSGRIDTLGLNQGMAELASGPEISGYFDQVMRHRLLPSGRVRYHPLCDYLGEGRFESLLSGEHTQVRVRGKVVDARYYSPSVPSTHKPRFAVGEGARMIPPNALPGLASTCGAGEVPRRFVVLGAGKTAMDTCIWLVQSGASPDAITWVVPRDSWLINRATTQNGPAFFHEAIGNQADQMEAFAQASSVDDLFLRLEACGALLRIDPARMPTMFHLATVSPAEVEVLRGIRNVVRLGRVQALAADHMLLDGGRVDVQPATLYVDCTASAVDFRPTQPIFQEGKIVLQMLRLPQPAFSAALTAYVEAHYEDDAQKNRLCGSVPFPATPADYPRSMAASMRNQFLWGQEEGLRRWVRESRLDGFGKLMASAARDDAAKQAVIARLREQAQAAMANLPRLLRA
ncbi:NAD(P)-binding protein [Variovorax terrae]|uniref:NAD(P)-binding protein n=1 Tax=Variovorax terrae TaxID=2923278 RepID=A0A9X1W077_9BURK|nr:NAD(P)-binding protein [Variovorax terrae]MCJ0763673.1 NAD(P)-binding protein [Variovorax terrae]